MVSFENSGLISFTIFASTSNILILEIVARPFFVTLKMAFDGFGKTTVLSSAVKSSVPKTEVNVRFLLPKVECVAVTVVDGPIAHTMFIEAGKTVTIQGRVVGYDDLMGELKLDQCAIIKPQTK
jgi:adenylate kinase